MEKEGWVHPRARALLAAKAAEEAALKLAGKTSSNVQSVASTSAPPQSASSFGNRQDSLAGNAEDDQRASSETSVVTSSSGRVSVAFNSTKLAAEAQRLRGLIEQPSEKKVASENFSDISSVHEDDPVDALVFLYLSLSVPNLAKPSKTIDYRWDDRRFWNPGVFSYAMKPRCQDVFPNSRVFFFSSSYL
jgi:hypothetical protein